MNKKNWESYGNYGNIPKKAIRVRRPEYMIHFRFHSYVYWTIMEIP